MICTGKICELAKEKKLDRETIVRQKVEEQRPTTPRLGGNLRSRDFILAFLYNIHLCMVEASPPFRLYAIVASFSIIINLGTVGSTIVPSPMLSFCSFYRKEMYSRSPLIDSIATELRQCLKKEFDLCDW